MSVDLKNVNRKIITMLFIITCQSFFMVNALIKKRTTAGSDYWIIIISLCHHNRERKRCLYVAFGFSFFWLSWIAVLYCYSYKETTRYKQDLLQKGRLAFVFTRNKPSISHIKRYKLNKVNAWSKSYLYILE